MTRRYDFSRMTVEDHRSLFNNAPAPTAAELQGVWRMDTISNANHATGVAWLAFDDKPDGRLESRYRLMGLIEGLAVPSFAQGHFQLDDFTPFRDEIRRLSGDLLIGKWITEEPVTDIAGSLPLDLGIFHREPPAADGTTRWGFYYLLTRAGGEGKLPSDTLLDAWLDHPLPRGVGMTFDEEMVGRFWEDSFTPSADRKGDLTIAARPEAGSGDISFRVRMTIHDVNDFVDSDGHEARLSGTIRFGSFLGLNGATYTIDAARSYFNYLRVRRETGEAEMRYHLEWSTPDGRRFSLDGRKYMQKDASGPREVLQDYTTLYAHVFEHTAQGLKELGTGLLKFRTFEDLAAIGNLAGFLAMQLMARLRFLGFTGRFVQREYDPLALPVAVSGAVAGGGN
jgi:hypothetical protein